MQCCTLQGGLAQGTPDVCKTPMPPVGQPTPIPYPDLAVPSMAQPVTKKVLVSGMPALNKSSKITVTNGDNAGVAGGIKSSTFMQQAEFTMSSNKVKLEGAFAVRMGDMTQHNNGNIVGTVIAPSQVKVMVNS